MTNIAELPPMQHIFTVTNLLNYDMIYIYHHIQEGGEVTLKRDLFMIDGNYSYTVYFRGFKIGSIMVSSLFTAIYGHVNTIRGNVASITKEKYLPIRALDIIIRQTELKLVS